MQVYKAFFMIIKKNIPLMFIYIFIFLFFALILANVYTDPEDIGFSEAKVNMAFINQDESSDFSQNLEDYLGPKVNLVHLEDSPEDLQDALFFREVEYIVRIPKGFTQSLFRGDDAKLEKIIVPNSTSSVYIDSLINKYVNTASLYAKNIDGLSQGEIIELVNSDLSMETEVSVLKQNASKSGDEKCRFYFNFLTFSLFSVLILGVSTVMKSFNKDNIRMRNSSSPMKLRSMNVQMILGNLSFALIAWLIMIAPGFILFYDYTASAKGVLLCLNSLVFALSVLSISFLIGNVVKGEKAIPAATNLISNGMCFISGVFVPQRFMGDFVMKLASFTPTYWYVKTNDIIAEVIDIGGDNLTAIFTNILIMLGFGLTTLALALVIKTRRKDALL